MAFCTQCGTPSSPGKRYCVVCGSPLPVPTASTDPTTPSSATPAWIPAPPLRDDANRETSSLVLLGIADSPPSQSRLTVLFRAFLCLPLFVWLALLSIASGLCVMFAWFAALFTRRVPPGIQEFVTDVLRYSTEVQAYAAVLVGRWPGFSLRGGPQSQMSLRVNAFPLNRAAVFFRYFLTFPALVVLVLVNFGSYLLSALAWITALVLGRPATPVYEARVLALRFATRCSAYMYLLTPTQPFSGFFGDPGEDPTPETAVVAGETPANATPLTTRLHLSTGGRIVFILSLVAGLVFGGWYVTSFKSVIGRVLGPAVVSGTNQMVLTAMNTLALDFPHCVAAQDAQCARTDATSAASALSIQINVLNTFEGLISRGRGQYVLYLDDLERVRDDLKLISSTTTVAPQNALYRNNLVVDYGRLEAQYPATYAAL